jgi:Ca2+-binding EF-hand superfamily protein
LPLQHGNRERQLKGLKNAMRRLALIVTGLSCLAAQPALAKNAVYLSLMGEPFRTNEAGEDPFDQWFKLADTDGDGSLTRVEFRADAQAFFEELDTNGDKVIDGQEMAAYEQLAPSRTRVAGGGGPELSSARPKATSSAPVQKGEVAIVATGDAPSATRVHPGSTKINFSEVPQPVAMADLNIDGRVTLEEFLKTAGKRFANYDVNQDQRLTRDELR